MLVYRRLFPDIGYTQRPILTEEMILSTLAQQGYISGGYDKERDTRRQCRRRLMYADIGCRISGGLFIH